MARFSWLVLAALFLLQAVRAPEARADDGALIEVRFTPTQRAQIAVWIEDDRGRLLQTFALTESVAFRGIGNRPGASEMNSGYHWPYGRREGVLPLWARSRADAPGAQPFKRVVFQKRDEGRASQTTTDQSVDDYFCLSFTLATTTRDALDAVSCASVFRSDKGRFMNESDLVNGYAEPWEEVDGSGSQMMPLPLTSLYPPRMDVTRCTDGCFDSIDVDAYVEHARHVMPDIDAITMATPQGDQPQSLLFSIPSSWPKGSYTLWVEVATEGDYGGDFADGDYPTPTTPNSEWDSWATGWGYAYRGQPSIAYSVPLELGEAGMVSGETSRPTGQSSWNVWAPDYGTLEPIAGVIDDPRNAPGSGADRLRAIDGVRLSVEAEVIGLAEPVGDDPWAHVFDENAVPPVPVGDGDGDGDGDPGDGDGDGDGDAGEGGQGGAAGGGVITPGGDGDGDGDGNVDEGSGGEGVILDHPNDDGSVGPVRDLKLTRHSNPLRAHTWVQLEFRAVEADQAIHRYEVRESEQPIVDELSFIRSGRPARTASEDAEGSTALMIPTDDAPGTLVRATVGELTPSTHHYIAVRAVDRRNRSGPISVAEISTPSRTFATVTPCFIATAAYGTELAPEIGVLRRARDRYLMPHALGRALVRQYYAWSPRIAQHVQAHPWLARSVRGLLAPLVGAFGALER